MSDVVLLEDFGWEPWKNGQGLTRVLWQDSRWRLSIAEIKHSSRFSIFEGQTREIGLMHGHGITLQPDDAALACMELAGTGECFCFSGAIPLKGCLHDGPVQVLNLMYGNGQHYTLRPLTQVGPVHNLQALVPVRGVWRVGEEHGAGATLVAGTSLLRLPEPQNLHLRPMGASLPLAYGVFASVQG